jgi:hypothetical protein
VSAQVFHANGALLLDVSDRLTRFHSSYQLNAAAATQNGFISVAGMSTDGTWVAYCGMATGAPDIYIVIGSGGFTWYRFGTIGVLTSKITVLRT